VRAEAPDRRREYYPRIERGDRVTKGENDYVRVTLIHVPGVDVQKVRLKMGLSQAEFATKFGFPPATLRNWEQGGSHPDERPRVSCWRLSQGVPKL
jgi:DNA-binding transcriptional regulator YiaG